MGKAFHLGVFAFLISLPGLVKAQTQTQKEINQQVQFWTSINTVTRFSERWGLIADFHLRRNNFIQDPSFSFIRVAADYWISEKMTVALGYGHMWVAPAQEDWNTNSDENRIYQQFQDVTKSGKSLILQRFRSEERWQQIIVSDKWTGDWKFSVRLRYLYSYNFPVFKNTALPTMVVSDEILVQFGKDIVYNTYDQNRLFLGIKYNINSRLSFDFGYMNVFQEKSSGYQYDMNHTIRLFFYYNSGWGHSQGSPNFSSGDE